MKNAMKENIGIRPVLRKSNLRAYNIVQSESCIIESGAVQQLNISKHIHLKK